MKSPITGGNATLKSMPAEQEFRGEKYAYTYRYYVCDDTGEEFTTTEIDEANIQQVYDQYRQKYGVPTPAAIQQTREKYGLSAALMSRILGWGDNQYRLYESGIIPSLANSRTLAVIANPFIFLDYVEIARRQLSDKDYEKAKENVVRAIVREKESLRDRV